MADLVHVQGLALAYGIHDMSEMRTGRLILRVSKTRRKLRLCQRTGHPRERMVALSHIKASEGQPWVKVRRIACARCGWHGEPTTEES